jgi:isopenicillin N synthase-like dioxygenase
VPSTSDLNQDDPIVGMTAGALPILSAEDILGDRRDSVVEQVREACLTTGFLIIEPTPEMQATIAATLGRMQAFFSLSDDDPRKQAVRQGESRSGWRPRYTEPAYQPGTVSSLEAFDLGLGELRSDQHDVWPDIPEFRAATSQCWHEYLQLADAILELIASAAGLDSDFLVSRCQSRELNSFRLLHYAADVAEHTGKDVGISAHTDFECITLLYQDSPGLELRAADGRWLDAEFGVGRIVVMLDDMLERWTNGFFSATGHRVRRTATQRHSIVMFMAVDDGIAVVPQEQFVSGEEPPRFAAVTQADHLAAEVRRAEKNSTPSEN